MQDKAITDGTMEQSGDNVSNRVFTAANVITFIRLCLIPASLVLLLEEKDIAAAALFAFTASTDFVDGYVARKTNTVTHLGQVLDPLVDRLLIIAAVLGLLVVGRLPVWVVIIVLLRDLYLLAGAAFLIGSHQIRIPVSYIGKVGMWFLCIGFAGLILNLPIFDGLGICSFDFFPGFNAQPYCPFIWSVYVGIALSLTVTVVYTVRGVTALSKKLAADRKQRDAH